jgi:hypothetical protein
MFATDSGIGFNTYRRNSSSGGRGGGTMSALNRRGGIYLKNVTIKKRSPIKNMMKAGK